jgi:hypothetical protein
MSLGGANTSSAPEHPRVTVDARRCMHDQSRGSSEGLSRPRRRHLNERRRVGAERPADRARQQRILDTCGCPPARPAVLASSRSTTGARPVPFEPELFRRGGSDRGCGPFVNGERTHLVPGWAEGDDLEACRVALRPCSALFEPGRLQTAAHAASRVPQSGRVENSNTAPGPPPGSPLLHGISPERRSLGATLMAAQRSREEQAWFY